MYQSKLQDAQIDALFEAMQQLETKEEYYRFFEDISTVSEIKALAQRMEVAKMLDLPYPGGPEIDKLAEKGDNFGTVLVPEGLLEFVPEMKALIAELNDLLAGNNEFKMLQTDADKYSYVLKALSSRNASVFETLPLFIAKQLTMDRDAHGNVQVSLIETEKLLSEMVANKLAAWKAEGKYTGKFNAQHHFFGYEGRCAAPSNYDADYCYALGTSAAQLVANGKTGYMAIVKNTTAPAAEWVAGGVPITMMMNMERRHGAMKPVIRKALVRLDGAPFKEFAAHREEWAEKTAFVYPGPIQYFGPTEVCDQCTMTLKLEQAK